MPCDKHNGQPCLQDFYHNRFNEFSRFAEKLQGLTTSHVAVHFCLTANGECEAGCFKDGKYAKGFADNVLDAFFEASDNFDMGVRGE